MCGQASFAVRIDFEHFAVFSVRQVFVSLGLERLDWRLFVQNCWLVGVRLVEVNLGDDGAKGMSWLILDTE